METPQVIVIDGKVITGMRDDIKEMKSLLQKINIAPDPKFLTRKEFLKAIKASTWTWDELIQQNLLKTQRIGRKWFVPASEVDRYYAGDLTSLK